MKKAIYRLINKFGYSIENKANRQKELEKPLIKFNTLLNFNLLVQAKNYVINLDSKFSNFSITNHKEGFLINFLDLKIYVESLEEFNILNEVFVNNDYNYKTTENSILIDIGTNIGITSLFFSKLRYIKAIYAFEPILDTFEQAKYNFSLNKNISKVKSFKNIGLGMNNRSETFFYNKRTKGNTGIRGELSPSYSNQKNTETRDVIICDVSVEFDEILKNLSGEKVIVKMDCEGAEYEIIENLHKSGILNKIDVLLIEWHDKGSRVIEDTLLDCGFCLFSQKLSPITGMIYAYKV